MATYLEQSQIVTRQDLSARTAQCLVRMAYNVMQEAPGTDARRALARRCLYSPSSMAELFTRAVVNDPNAGSGGPNDPLENDSELEDVVMAAWDSFAWTEPTP